MTLFANSVSIQFLLEGLKKVLVAGNGFFQGTWVTDLMVDGREEYILNKFFF